MSRRSLQPVAESFLPEALSIRMFVHMQACRVEFELQQQGQAGHPCHSWMTVDVPEGFMQTDFARKKHFSKTNALQTQLMIVLTRQDFISHTQARSQHRISILSWCMPRSIFLAHRSCGFLLLLSYPYFLLTLCIFIAVLSQSDLSQQTTFMTSTDLTFKSSFPPFL